MDQHLDARAGRVAQRQLGLITGGQARELGFTRHQIDTRATSGRWTRQARDVFAIAGASPCWERDALAACLAGPPGSTASHATAAALWGLGRPTSRPHVTVPSSSGARLPLAEVHRSDLAPADVTRIGEIPVTRVARTLIDVASIWTEAALEQALDTAIDGGRTTAAQVSAAIDRVPRGRKRAGVAVLCDLLEAWTQPIQPESPAEARLVRRLASWGVAPPVLQHVVNDQGGIPIARIDVACPSTGSASSTTVDDRTARAGSSTTSSATLRSRRSAGRSRA
jgi:hypothetical protein